MDRTYTGCGVCAYKKKRCKVDCPLAPYFRYPDSFRDYDAIHRTVGYRNFLHLIERVSEADCQQTITSLVYEATSRLREPVLGCFSYILSLDQPFP